MEFKGMKLLIPISLVLIFIGSCKESEWIDHQGNMDWISWNDAKATCASIGRRLPTRDELAKAFETKVVESWKKDGQWHWSSDEYFKDRSYVYGFDIYFGETNIYQKDVGMHVCCIR